MVYCQPLIKPIGRLLLVRGVGGTCLTVTGFDITKAAPNGAFPSNVFVDQRKFFRRLGVRTDWANGTTGEVAGIKSGALYLVGAPAYDFNVQAYAKFKVYFKSVGNR